MSVDWKATQSFSFWNPELADVSTHFLNLLYILRSWWSCFFLFSSSSPSPLHRSPHTHIWIFRIYIYMQRILFLCLCSGFCRRCHTFTQYVCVKRVLCEFDIFNAELMFTSNLCDFFWSYVWFSSNIHKFGIFAVGISSDIFRFSIWRLFIKIWCSLNVWCHDKTQHTLLTLLYWLLIVSVVFIHILFWLWLLFFCLFVGSVANLINWMIQYSRIEFIVWLYGSFILT